MAIVNRIYRWLVDDDLPLSEIAQRLNDIPVYTDRDCPWTYSTVRQVLTNEKYIGNNVYNRHSFKLKKKHVDNPPQMWIRKQGAFEGIVPLDAFMAVQVGQFRHRTRAGGDGLIELLRTQVASVQTEPERQFKTGERVRLTEVPFAGIEGLYQMADGERRVMVLIEVLSKPVAVRVAPATLRKAS